MIQWPDHELEAVFGTTYCLHQETLLMLILAAVYGPGADSALKTRSVLGATVQNGKFAAPPLQRALNKEDFPTLGRPAKPHAKPMMKVSLCKLNMDHKKLL